MIYVLAALVCAAPVPPPITEAMPVTGALADEMHGLSDEALLAVVERSKSRLFIDDATPIIEVGTDLELALRFATAAQMLADRPVASGPKSRAIQQATRSAAFLLSEAGRAYETDEAFRTSVDALVPPPDDPAHLTAEAFVTSLRGLRAYARAWFPRALAAVPEADADPVSLAQEGQWLVGEGQLAPGVDRLTRALAMLPSERLALTAHAALLAIETMEADHLAAELVKSLVDRFPALAGPLALQARRAEDTRATRAFEKLRPTGGAEFVAQVARYLRLGRPGAAELLARDRLAAAPSDVAVWAALGEVLFATARPSALADLLADAARSGVFDTRLVALQRVVAGPPDSFAEAPTASEAARTYLRVTADLAAASASGGPRRTALDEAVRELDGLMFDASTHEGRAFSQAHLVTLATLASTLGEAVSTVHALYRAARGVDPSSALGLVAGGLAQTLVNDPAGAAELFERAFARAEDATLRVWIAGVLAEALMLTERAKAARFRKLAGAADANAGPFVVIQGGDAAPRWVLTPGEGVTAAVEVRPHVALLPRLPTSAASRRVLP